jgi:membrane associated rhomboid family serine protease
MFLVPVQVDVAMERWPVANWLLLASLALVFFMQPHMPYGTLEGLVLDPDAPLTWVTSMWLHAGIIHLLGNMVFLWVFGNAVCSKLGSLSFVPVYVGLGWLASATHAVFDGAPAVGASGAINAMVGMFLVFYPRNDVTCWYYLFPYRWGRFRVSSFWMILLWLVYDVLGLVLGGMGVAYAAHLGGFAAGFVLAFLLVRFGVLRKSPAEESLLALLHMEPGQPRDVRSARPGGAQSAGSASASPPARSGRSRGAVVTFECTCGTTLKAPPRLAGRHAKCPVCSQRVLIPEG